MNEGCHKCMFEALNVADEPCVECFDSTTQRYVHFVPAVPKYVIPDENTVHQLHTCWGTIHNISTLQLTQKTIKTNSNFHDPHGELRMQVQNIAGILARMICKLPVSVQLELLKLPYIATKEGTENV